jgi:hypothetical protein
VFQPLHQAVVDRLRGMIEPGGLLGDRENGARGVQAIRYSNDKMGTAYPQLALDWTGTFDLDFVAGVRHPRMNRMSQIKVGDHRIALALYCGSRSTKEEADKFMEDLLWVQTPDEDDYGLVPALDLFCSQPLVTSTGQTWTCAFPKRLYSGDVNGREGVPFCVGAGCILSFTTMGEIRRQ